ncbi:hypothetical protein CKO15_10805 [Halorhodospira abdelmalekii]|uniref:hypothetical protein n=1 Tax=Halorhodospira abdelmalekii TaxID=421629 RepID=UPI0019040C0E|nr:hypothetical protein [Halorhodospira abdelmalekii]MBK1735758.1 hypothetical protein [Halorhodospira abdelmalekii]
MSRVRQVRTGLQAVYYGVRSVRLLPGRGGGRRAWQRLRASRMVWFWGVMAVGLVVPWGWLVVVVR